MIERTTVGVSMPMALVAKLDSIRGSEPRSRVIVRLVERGLGDLLETKGQEATNSGETNGG